MAKEPYRKICEDLKPNKIILKLNMLHLQPNNILRIPLTSFKSGIIQHNFINFINEKINYSQFVLFKIEISIISFHFCL